MKLIKLLSLFTGIGAFEKSLDRLKIPYELVGFSEIDKYAVKSYCAMHGVDETKNLGDITKIDEKALPKDIDLITYGFPCQDISLAGKQKGLFNEDGSQTRSGLFFDALRIIEETKPKVAIAENVKNLVGKKFNAQFQVVLASLEAVGYNNYWQVLNAKDYGVPQNRERVFIVSIRKDLDNGTFSFPEGFPLELRLKDLLDDEVDEKYYLSDTAIAGFIRHKERHKARGNGFAWNPTDGNVIANTVCAAMPTRATDNYVITSTSAGNEKFLVREATKQGYAEAVEGDSINFEQPNSKTRRGRVGHQVAQTLTTSPQQAVVTAVAMRGRKNEDGTYEQNVEVSDREYANSITTAQKDSLVAEPYTIIGGMQKNQAVKTDGVCTTLTSAMGTGGGYVPMHNCTKDLRIRKLTPKECFRLMDFDDEDFIKAEAVNSNTQLYKQAGNSIVVAVPVAIIKALIDCGALEEKKENREMELIIKELQLPEAIVFNFEEIKQGLTEKVSYYETLVYTDEQIVDAKKDRANLNKLKKAMNDERKRIQEEYMQPLNDFKKKIDELIEIVDKPVKMIDGQVKAYEDKEKQDKLEAIKELFNSMGFQPFVKLEMIMDEKWLNKSESMKKIEEQMQNEMYRIGNEITTLSNLPEFGFEATEVYKTTLDINKAINEAKRMVEVAKARAEHEAKIKAQEEEQARLKAEAITQPTNPVGQVIESVERQAFENAMNPPKEWMSFKALLSYEDAVALGEFLRNRNIQFEQIA